MKRLTVILIALLALSSTRCQHVASSAQVVGSGIIIKQPRELPKFDAIVLRTSATMNIDFGEAVRCEIEGDDNIVPLIRTEVRNGRLVIDTSESFSTKNGPTLSLTIAALRAVDIQGSGKAQIKSPKGDGLDIAISGSGDVDATDVAARTIRSKVTGSGKIRLTGTTDSLAIDITGAGDVIALELAAKSADVRISGSGHAEVQAAESLSATIPGSGDVRYKGSPKVTKTITGSGTVRPM